MRSAARPTPCGFAMLIADRTVLRRLLVTEAIIGAVVNSVIGGLVAWLVFRGLPRVPVWGTGGVVADLLPSTFVPALLATLALSYLTGRRVAGGAWAAIAAVSPAAAPRALANRLVLRALVFAAGATIVALLVTGPALWLSGAETISLSTLAAIKLAQNALLGLCIAPLAISHALADRRIPA